MTLLNNQALLLIALSAIGYGIATLGLKMGSNNPGWMPMGIIILGFGLAILAEIEVLRRVDIGVAYISIIGLETLIVLSYAWVIGEALNLRQVGGAGMVVAGLAVLSY